MKKIYVTLVRYTASEGKSLRWRQRIYDFRSHTIAETICFAEREAVIEVEQLVGEVEEVPYEDYEAWFKREGCNLAYVPINCSCCE